MGRNFKQVDDLSKLIKIECLELPEHLEKDEGYYELRFANDVDNWESHDIITLRKRLAGLQTRQTVDEILDYLQNFRLAYLNLATGEMSS